MKLEPMEEKGLRQIKSRWPQAHIAPGKHGDGLVTIPGYELPSGWLCETLDGADLEPATICTVLFRKPCGFPAAKPDHFWVDSRLRLADRSIPEYANYGNTIHGFEWWKDLTWFSWHLQMWDPNRDTLYSFVNAIRMRLKPAH